VLAVDYAKESMFLRTIDAAFRMRVFNTSNGDELAKESVAKIADVVWATTNCALAWGVQGFWDSPHFMGKDAKALITRTDRPRKTALELCAAASTDGRVSVANWPLLEQGKARRAAGYKRHTGVVTQVTFSLDGKALLSSGGQGDCTIMQWRLVNAGTGAHEPT
jgi:hypothetical protein